MKHIWYINEQEFELKEGYIVDDKIPSPIEFKTSGIFDNENLDNLIYIAYNENIFDNKETAVNMFNGMGLIQIKKLENYINDCKNKIDILSDKLLMDNIVSK